MSVYQIFDDLQMTLEARECLKVWMLFDASQDTPCQNSWKDQAGFLNLDYHQRYINRRFWVSPQPEPTLYNNRHESTVKPSTTIKAIDSKHGWLCLHHLNSPCKDRCLSAVTVSCLVLLLLTEGQTKHTAWDISHTKVSNTGWTLKRYAVLFNVLTADERPKFVSTTLYCTHSFCLIIGPDGLLDDSKLSVANDLLYWNGILSDQMPVGRFAAARLLNSSYMLTDSRPILRPPLFDNIPRNNIPAKRYNYTVTYKKCRWANNVAAAAANSLH